MRSAIHEVELHRSASPGIEAMTLRSDRSFPRHSHDQFGIGLVLSGAHRSWSGIGAVEASAGDIITLNPGEIHDGTPVAGAARCWRIAYIEPERVARELEPDATAEFEIRRPALSDAMLAQRFHRFFRALTAHAPDALLLEQELVATLMHVLLHHAVRPPPKPTASPSVARARQRLDAAPEQATSLAELAALSGISRFQLLRGFTREVGTTPHAYLLQRRLRLVRRLLRSGTSPAEAALASGFSDQSHMTRAFVRQFGIGPGRYRAALA